MPNRIKTVTSWTANGLPVAAATAAWMTGAACAGIGAGVCEGAVDGCAAAVALVDGEGPSVTVSAGCSPCGVARSEGIRVRRGAGAGTTGDVGAWTGAAGSMDPVSLPGAGAGWGSGGCPGDAGGADGSSGGTEMIGASVAGLDGSAGSGSDGGVSVGVGVGAGVSSGAGVVSRIINEDGPEST